MTRENMFVDAVREDWMTPELENKLRSLTASGRISCARAQQFARENDIAMDKMKAFLDVLQMKVSSCQLGCF